MTNIQDFEKAKKAFMTIPRQEVNSPGIPMLIFHQEADDLVHWSRDDRDKLFEKGLDKELFYSFPMRINASREAQAQWNKKSRMKKDAQMIWQKKAPQFFLLRDDMLRSFRYAFRKEPKLLAVLDQIAEGYSNANIIQDFINLAVLGRSYTHLLKKIRFDLTKLDRANASSTEMRDILARANGERRSENETKIIRDRAYTYLKEAVDEIRDCGGYVFWNNEERLQGYQSLYSKKIAARFRAKKEEQQEV